MLVGRRSAEPSEMSSARPSLALPVVSIECSSILGVLTKQIARRKLLAGTRMQSIHLGHEFFQAVILRVSQRAAAERGKPRPENHAVICILRRCDDLLFKTARSFV